MASGSSHDENLAGWSAVFAVAALCCLPVILTPVAPLVDLYAHVSRFQILSGTAIGPSIAENYQAHWALLPNIGFDVLGTGLMLVVPPLAAARLIAVIMLLAPFLGTVYLSFVLHGRIFPLTAVFAGIAAHSSILVWGFSNFLLGLGLSLVALGLWIGQSHAPRRQLVTASILAIVILLCHGFAFMLWGLCLGMIELALMRERGALSPANLLRRAGRLLLIAVIPVLTFLNMPTAGAEGGAFASLANFADHIEAGQLWQRLWAEVVDRVDWFLRVSNSTYPVFDRILGAFLWLFLAAMLWRGWLRIDRRMTFAILLALLLVWITPPTFFSSGHLPKRLPLLLLVLIVAAPDFSGTRARSVAAIVLVAMLALRIAVSSWGWAQDGASYRKFLAVLADTDTGSLGARYSAAGFQREASRPNCAPLESLMLLKNGTSVPTFANSFQQPLRIIGPLAAAKDAVAALPDDIDAAAALAAYRAAGFDAIVLCSDRPVDAPEGLRAVASDGAWTLFTAVR